MKQKLLAQIFIGVSGVFLVTLFQNCSNGLTAQVDSGGANLASSIGEEDVATKPIIDCDIKNKDSGAVLRRIHSATPKDSFSGSILEFENVNIDCSRTARADGNPGQFKYDINFDTRKSVVATNAFGQFSHSFGGVDIVPMKLVVTDNDGHQSIKEFNVLLKCREGASAPLAINKSAVRVNLSNQNGFFNYDASGAVSGGTGNNSYAWDFSGDNGFDLQFQAGTSGKKQWISWSTSSRADFIYNMFAGPRNIHLYVKDSCNNIAQAQIPINFQYKLPRLASNARAEARPLEYYLQADIRPSAKLNKPSVDSILVTRADLFVPNPLMPPDGIKRFQCSYSRDVSKNIGGLVLKAKNTYGETTDARKTHGMDLRIGDIKDSGQFGAPLQIGTPAIYAASYLVSEVSDFKANSVYTFNAESGCRIELTMNRIKTVGTCEGNPSVPNATLQFLGEFKCDALSSAVYGDIAVENAKFYCEISEADQCPGGGGGGGQPPPSQ